MRAKGALLAAHEDMRIDAMSRREFALAIEKVENEFRYSLVEEVAKKVFAEDWNLWKWDDPEYEPSRAAATHHAKFLLGITD